MYEENKLMSNMISFVRHYNHHKYWKMRNYVVSPNGCRILKYYYLFRIKRSDAFNNASFGTHIGFGASFETTPDLPHGICGTFISHNARIGKNLRMYHHVTIGEGKGGAPKIGDNCLIGAGAKIIGNIKIGNNVKIGAGCVVSQDIPDDCTVVMNSPRIIVKKGV